MNSNPPSTDSDALRVLHWAHGELQLHAFGGMLAPVVFRAEHHADFSPLQVAPWADDPQAHDRWPGLLGHLRGEWPCVPFGRCDRPAGLPADWLARRPADPWAHGHASHHRWEWLPSEDALALVLSIELPAGHPVRRLTRTVRAVADAAAVEIELQIDARQPCRLPVALHPTLRLDAGRVELDLRHDGPGFNYPVPAEPGRSRLAPGARFEQLASVPLADGGTGDFSRYPQPADGEDLLQVMEIVGPVTARFVDAGWALTLDWERALLPDLLLWISHRGRLAPPWSGRHFALGLEPLNSAWDLGRIGRPPAEHPLAARSGLALHPDAPCVIRSRLSAQPLAPST